MKRPNILLVFNDQLRHDVIQALGNPIIRTPVLDQLVDTGVTFDRAYTPCPVCVPARYAMHVGKLPHRTGVVENTAMPEGRTSFMEILRDQGYQTFGVGKMHFTFPGTDLASLWGFEKRANCESAVHSKNDFYQNTRRHGYNHVHEVKGVKSEMYYIPQVSQLPAELHETAWTADASIDFLRNRDTDRPFFMMTSFDKPHPPFEPPTPWNKLYRGPEMPLPHVPADTDSLLTLWNRFQNRYKYRDRGTDLNLIRQIKAHYYAEISFIDYSLGRLFEEMKRLNVYDDTVIIFTADHGELLGDYGSFGKRCFLDPAARIPLLMKWPGCAAGSVCTTPASLVDVFPTLLEFAGAHPEEPCDGENLVTLAEGTSDRTVVRGQYEEGEYACYMRLEGSFKYVYSAPDQREFLFDLANDPHETVNKAENPLYIGKTREMRDAETAYYRSEGYSQAVDADSWRRYEVKTMPRDPDAYLLFQDVPESLPQLEGYSRPISSKEYARFHWYEDRYPGV